MGWHIMKAKMEFSKKLVVSFVFFTLLLMTSCAKDKMEKQMDNTQSHTQYKESVSMLESGRDILKEKKSGNEKKAIELFKSGIETLGVLYKHPDLIDDTEMKLILAENNLQNEKATEAVVLFERVLESRLTVYEEHYKLKPQASN